MANNIDPISMTMGWLVGRRIAGQRGKKIEPDVPSGGYDDTFPIEWDMASVENNPNGSLDEMVFVKISNLTEIPNAESTVLSVDGEIGILVSADGDEMISSYSYSRHPDEPGVFDILVAIKTADAAASAGFPETGLYLWVQIEDEPIYSADTAFSLGLTL